MNRAKQLQQYLDQQKPFDWDGNNCCHYVARWIEQLENRNPLATLPPMRSKETAYRIIIGFGGWEHTVSQLLARPSVESVWLQTGDAILVDVAPGVKSLGLVNGRYASCLSEHGVEHMPIPSGSLGWKVARD